RDSAAVFVKQTFIDILLRRTVEEKISNYCHINCIRDLGNTNFKKNGRWGFIMIMGFTEIFSSLFALLNAIFASYCFRRHISPNLHKTTLRKLITAQYYICNIAFLSSALFHMRETALTRYADYFSAFLSIVIGLAFSVGRLVHHSAPHHLDKYTKYSMFTGFLFFIVHLYKMLFIEWDYAYNKYACGIMFACLCFCDLFLYFNIRDMRNSHNILFYIGALLVAGAAEMSDIAPYMLLFDSHAFWHLFMLVSSYFYYSFVIDHIEHFAEKLKQV
ncbi:post-GPI attachment to proteins factor 3, partial [Pancytospora epiphaga]